MLDSFYTVYQAEVDGAAQDLLRTAGICGGDTLWILSSVLDEQESSQSDRHSHTTSASQGLQSSQQSSQAAEQQSSQAAEQQSSQAAEQQSSQAAEQQTPQQVSTRTQEMQEAHKPDMQQPEQVHPVSIILSVWNKTKRHMTFILICFLSNSSCRVSRHPTSPSPVRQTCCSECWTVAQQLYRVRISCCY